MEVKNYTVLKQETIKELNGIAYLMQHDRTKARVLVIGNDDKNKVFNIGFRTPECLILQSILYCADPENFR